jgi:hypothetical protein
MRATLSVAVGATARGILTAGFDHTRALAQSGSNANANGDVRTIATRGSIDRRNAFFRPLGKQYATTCEHCHFSSDG